MSPVPALSINGHIALSLNSVLNGTPDGRMMGIMDLYPPLTNKGRYILVKLADNIAPDVKRINAEKLRLAELYAKKDLEGKVMMTQEGDRIAFDMDPAGQTQFNQELKAILDEKIEVQGIRQITHAELGDCPLTGRQERILISAGVLEDKEPE